MIDVRELIDSAEVIGHLDEMTEEEWMEQRRQGIGGSDAGAIMQASKWSSPLSVWMEKTGRSTPEALDSEAVNFGKDMEPLIRHELFPKYLQKNYEAIATVIDPMYMWRNKNRPWQQANVDGWVFFEEPIWGGSLGLAGLEIKTGSSYMLIEWGGVDGNKVPDSYYWQVQHYMDVFNMQLWIVFGVIGNARLIRFVPRDQAHIDEMRESQERFWAQVRSNDPLQAPLPIGTDADAEALFSLGSPQVEDTATIEASMAHSYIEAREAEKKAKEDKEYYRQQLLMTLGQCKYGESIDGHYRVTHSRFSRTSVDTKTLRRDHPEIISIYETVSETGRISIKEM